MLPNSLAAIGTATKTASATGVLIPSSNGQNGTGWIDTSNSDFLAVQITISATATINVEGSFDGGTTVSPQPAMSGAGVVIGSAISASGIYIIEVPAPLTRLNVAANTGTVTLAGGNTDVQNAPFANPGSLPAGGNTIGTVNNVPVPGTTYTGITTAATLSASIKGSAGNLSAIALSNITANAMYVKFYNKATAPTVGTDVPVITIPVAAGATVIQEFGDEGLRFSTGIGIGVSGGAADTDTTANLAGAHLAVGYS